VKNESTTIKRARTLDITEPATGTTHGKEITELRKKEKDHNKKEELKDNQRLNLKQL
jgi:hypothetical protein